MLWELMLQAGPVAIDLIRRMLTFNASKRATAEEACQHAYLAEYNEGGAKQVQREEPALLSEWLTITGVASLPMEQLQNLIFQEMLHFHPETINLAWGASNP